MFILDKNKAKILENVGDKKQMVNVDYAIISAMPEELNFFLKE